MIILDNTTRKLQVLMGGAATSTNPDYTAYYIDITSSAFTPGHSNGTLNGSTAVDVVAAPASSTYRQIKALSIPNLDTVTNTITVRYNDNATLRKILVASVNSGYSLNYEDGKGWYILDASGSILTNPGSNIIVQDSTFYIKDNSDSTKITQFECSGITTGTTRTLTIPNASGTLMLAGNNLSDLASAATSRTNLGVDVGLYQVVTQIFTASGTYTPTSNMVYCLVKVQGAGGGSGGSATSGGGQLACGGAGGGGGYTEKLFTAATIGASQTVTIGAVGTAGAAGNNNGGAGGTTTFGSLLTANGGAGGSGGAAAALATNYTVAAGAGGSATGGDFNIPGAAGVQSNLTVGGFILLGGGGASFMSNILPFFPTGGATAAVAGPNYGAGATGGCTVISSQIAGAAGGSAVIIVIEFIKRA